MNNITSLICKTCGGHLSYKNNCVLICDSCEAEIVIDEPANNFNVIAGKLENYVGSSTTVIIPNTVMTIGENVFKDSTNLTSVVIPSSVTRIENHAFEGCTNLFYIDIPESVKYIGDSAFKNSGLNRLTINGDLSYLGQEAFMCCYNLDELTIVGRIERSGLKVFKQCSKLTTVNMDLSMFSGSLKASMEAKKDGDKRPTFFDFFQGSLFYNELQRKHSAKKCFYCNGDVVKGVCNNCGEKDCDFVQGCYVATCVYGSYDCPQVWTLRRYRDDTLGSTWYGRLFIRTYYAISPTLVKWFGKTSWFKKLWKGKLDRMVAKLQSDGVESTPYQDKNW
ncbi:MAG: leucine-rich repeat domain-containing protein [Clostridia bacterium]|nr:leucine-rich repeat domain-containing protein [Clostridia bacterium]